MKKILSLITVVTVLIASCHKDVHSMDHNNGNGNATVTPGDYIVTKFTDASSGGDQASMFSGYTFTFKNDGTVIAVKNGVGETGTYTQKPSHEGEAAKLDIEFNSEPLEELNKNWQVDLISPDAIHLSDDGNASEVLQFTAE